MKQPEKNSEFQNNNQNPAGQSDNNTPKTYSEEEYKNAQSFGTKANQNLINTSKKLAEKDPKELLGMDVQIQNKVIKDIWGYDNLSELKVMLPDAFEESGGDNGADNSDELVQLKREQELLRMKLGKKEVDDEIEKFTSNNTSVVKSIQDFDSKVRDELQYISTSLPAKERVKRATKIIAGNTDVSVEAYLQLQGKNNIKSNNGKLTDDYVLLAQNKMRAELGLKLK